MLIEGNNIKVTSLLEVLIYRAQHQSDKLAYIFLQDGETESVSFTYGELDSLARQIAAHLQSWQGERALLLYPSGLEFITAFFGCLYAGIVAVPVYPPKRNQKLTRLLFTANDAQAKVALTTTSILAEIEKKGEQEALTQLKWVATDTIKANPQEFIVKSVTSESLAFLQYTSGSTGTPKGVMVTHGNIIHNQQLIQQAFWHSEKTIVVGWLPLFHDMGLIGHVLQPIYAGFTSILMPAAAFIQKPICWLKAISKYRATTSGGPNFAYELCVSKITDVQRASLDLSSWEVAFNGSEPVRNQTLERFAATFASCGFHQKAFYPCYGIAEATLMVTGGVKTALPMIRHVDRVALEQNLVVQVKSESGGARALVGCGQTWLNQKIALVDPKTLTLCSSGQVGEIWVHGPSVAGGYWNRPQETKLTFHAQLQAPGVSVAAQGNSEPFLRTGDLGCLLDGELFITGRLKDVIIIQGRNHYPQDIELTVEQCHPALRPNCGAAFSVEIADRERLVVVQEVERSYLRQLNANEVMAAIRQAVAEEHDLQAYAVLLLKTASLPKTSSGKVQRSACRAGFLARSLDVVSDRSVNPRNQSKFRHLEAEVETLAQQIQTGKPQETLSKSNNCEQPTRNQQPPHKAEVIQSWLISKVAEHLEVAPEQIDIRQPFAQYGLSSLTAMSISGEAQEWLEHQFSPTLLYDYPNIEILAHLLAQKAAGDNQEAQNPAPLMIDIGGTQKEIETEAIAIIGLGCRFPGAKNPVAFWKLLHDGVDAIKEVPLSRWDINAFYDPTPATAGKMNTGWGGFLEQVDRFDPQFFGIPPREAQSMDPQQRLLLEVSWEALESAGQPPEQLAGSQTGVFIGISNYDYSHLQFKHTVGLDAYSGTGSAISIIANRLSYFLDLRGPSWAVDTACSSSLVAVHQAIVSLRQGECQLAIAGGVNLILTPQPTIIFSQARMMAADGRCKAFDASADGYVRGEGCGVVVLKRLSDALRNGDHIQAVIRGSAVNQDGRSNSLTAPNGPSQQSVIRRALKNAGVTPAQISYVEAHGTGTSLGDPIEVNSLKEVLMAGREREQPAWIGSVKTNIGHLEAAAGIAGLIKVVLSLQHEEIPPQLHLKQLNPYIDLEATPLSIPTKHQKWLRGNKSRLAGVSSFGFGGTNAHVILEEAPTPAPMVAAVERSNHVFTLSAKSEKALQKLAQAYQTFLADNAEASVADVCFTANTGRSHFNHRLAVVAESTVQLLEQLDAFATNRETLGLVSGQGHSRKCQKIAFLFTGEGSQYIGMGRQLYETQSTFRASLDRCNELLHPYLEKPLLSVLYPEPGQTSPLDQSAYSQPALFALEYALAQMWKSWGIEPTAVMGYSVGEYVAATVAGVLSLEHGLKLIAERSRLMQSLLTSDEIQTSHAFHSPVMEPILAQFRQVAATVSYAAPQIDLISHLTGERLTTAAITPEYGCRHLHCSVQFAASIQTLHANGYQVFVEIGPKPTLLEMSYRHCLPETEGVWLPSLSPGQSDWLQVLQ
ncbi:MAG: AMP-binding protein, partial [Chroococcidiopsidaceae cyanobacterium CP_BM_RX_35]|nr:AMP-binding protein [Chroococcidiopsidaceae cyanobacterium CP_BM_RX_35]